MCVSKERVDPTLTVRVRCACSSCWQAECLLASTRHIQVTVWTFSIHQMREGRPTDVRLPRVQGFLDRTLGYSVHSFALDGCKAPALVLV